VQPAARRLVLVDKPGSAQSEVRIGWIGVPRATPDYFPLEVMNTVLGGTFTSRLNQNLREQHGYSYGASSYFDMRRGAGPFLAAAAVQTDKTAEAVSEFFKELTAIRTPVPAPELAKARNNIVLGFPGEFETSTQLSRKLEDVLTYALPEDYFSRYTSLVQAVSASQVQQAAAKYIVPDRMLVVVVGDRKSVEAGLRALMLGTFDVMTVDQALGVTGAN
jgi:zinc protease